MKKIYRLLLSLMILYILWKIIKPNIIEGIDAEESTEEVEESTEEVEESTEEVEERRPCTEEDYIQQEAAIQMTSCGENGTIGGTVSEDLGPGPDSSCTCTCNEGYHQKYGGNDHGCKPPWRVQQLDCYRDCEQWIETHWQEDRVGGELNCEDVNLMISSGCANDCYLVSGGTEVTDRLLKEELLGMKFYLGCRIPLDDLFIKKNIDSLDAAIIQATKLGVNGFTFDTFRKMSVSSKEQLYTDESIVNITRIKDEIILRIEEKCNATEFSGEELEECYKKAIKDTLEYGETLSREATTFSDAMELFRSNYMFYSVVEDLIGYVRNEDMDYNYNDLLNELNIYVSLFEDIEEYQKDYEEFSSKLLTEEKRKDGDQAAAFRYNIARLLKAIKEKDIDKIFVFYLKGMACRKNIIGKIQPQYKKIPRMIYDKDTGSEVLANKNKILNECVGNRCVGNDDITKIHICPKLKYKKDLRPDTIGNTDDKCCDLSFFEKVILFFQDLF